MVKKRCYFSRFKQIYDKKYKKLMAIPLAIFIASLLILGFWKASTGEFVSKDVSLTGGLSVTIQTDKALDVNRVKVDLSRELGTSVNVKQLTSIGTAGAVGYVIELEKVADEATILEKIQTVSRIELTPENYSVEEMSSALGSAFWRSTLKAVAIAFICMAVVVLLYFRNPVVSGAIILSVIFDLVGTLAVVNLFGLRLSTAGVAALLMVLGYSVDTDILLSSRVLKQREGTILDRIISAARTGLTMQLTTLSALFVMFLVSPAEILKAIALILIISIFIDISSTWLMNAGLLRWWLEVRHKE